MLSCYDDIHNDYTNTHTHTREYERCKWFYEVIKMCENPKPMNIKINQLFIHTDTAECTRHCRHTAHILDINNNVTYVIILKRTISTTSHSPMRTPISLVSPIHYICEFFLWEKQSFEIWSTMFRFRWSDIVHTQNGCDTQHMVTVVETWDIQCRLIDNTKRGYTNNICHWIRCTFIILMNRIQRTIW